ncbi:MAG: D-glycero-alpha-D-manno-heptose-1,7-bisphosphate 7-phosphatase [Candidatus Saccharimonadales bacterium]
MKAVLLDRDGTLIVDRIGDRVDAIEKVELLPHTLDALAHLATHNFGIIIVTNQTSIAQGRINEDDFWRINNHMLEQFEPSGIEVLKTFVCPHDNGAGCACRKPEPGLLVEAVPEFGLDSQGTYIVGDRLSDVRAGINAGIKTILVETGKFPVVAPEATYTAPHLLDAAKYIVANQAT